MENNGNNRGADEALGLVLALARGLTAHPGEVRCDVERRPSTWWLRLTVASNSDAKKLVGKGGGHIRALDSVAKMAFRRAGLTVSLRKVEVSGAEPDQFTAYRPRADWPRAELRAMLADAGRLCLGRECAVDERDGDGATVMILRAPGAAPADARALGLALAVLMLPIGASAGRRVHADVAAEGGA